jgi:hypothetical protein
LAKRVVAGIAIALALIGVIAYLQPPPLVRFIQKLKGMKTVEDRLAEYGPDARDRLLPEFRRQGLDYPPHKLILVGLKQEKQLLVYASGQSGDFHLIKAYPILAASGKIGPKLREGDGQVPEGIYKIVFLNPNSLYHLSLRLNYPNDFDLEKAAIEDRVALGQDIMIHGGDRSIGCLAMGDPASEDLFVLVADTGIQNTKVILSPVDLRRTRLGHETAQLPGWTDELYRRIGSELKALPLP